MEADSEEHAEPNARAECPPGSHSPCTLLGSETVDRFTEELLSEDAQRMMDVKDVAQAKKPAGSLNGDEDSTTLTGGIPPASMLASSNASAAASTSPLMTGPEKKPEFEGASQAEAATEAVEVKAEVGAAVEHEAGGATQGGEAEAETAATQAETDAEVEPTQVGEAGADVEDTVRVTDPVADRKAAPATEHYSPYQGTPEHEGYTQDAQPRNDMPASNLFQQWRGEMMLGEQTPCACGYVLEACMVCGRGSAQRQALLEESSAGQATHSTSAQPEMPAASAEPPRPSAERKPIHQLREEAQQAPENKMSSLEGIHGRLVSAEVWKCSKCNADLTSLKSVYKGKSRPLLQCVFCNRASVMVARHLEWPNASFQSFTSEQQAAFWAEAAEIQQATDSTGEPQDIGLKYSKLRAVFKKHLMQRRMEEWILESLQSEFSTAIFLNGKLGFRNT